MIDGWGISCEIALIQMSLNFTDDQSTLVQVMAWCRQATSHYLSQCWPRSLSPFGVTRPQWVNSLGPVDACIIMVRRTGLPLFQAMTCRLLGAKPLPEAIHYFLPLRRWGTNFSGICIKIRKQSLKKMLKISADNCWPFGLCLNL